jgi:hypothetical protein
MSKMEDAALLVARCTMATLLVKVDDLQFASLRVLIDPKNYPRHMLGCAAWFGWSPWRRRIMNPRRFAIVAAALCGTVVLAGWMVAWLAGFGSAEIVNTGVVPIEDRRASSLIADTGLADAPQAPAMGNAAVANADVAAVAESVTRTATDTTPTLDEPKTIVEAASPDSSQILPAGSSPVQVATASMPDPEPNDVKEPVSSIKIPDDCPVADSCIDLYLWALYQRTPKEDTIKVQERRKVAVRKKRKTVTVTRSFTKLVDEDFTWKDPKAAEKARMPMMDYVIGGMDRSFKLKLFHTLRAAEEAGLSPGITSAFRDNYRQAIASGQKAATDRSYHGGSFRGGYGHGLAADVVSVQGGTRDERWASSEKLWKWIDAHGNEFGIGRPYLDRDPPHVAPIDGKEYAAHHRGTKVQHAQSDIRKRSRQALRDDHGAVKTSKKRRIAAIQRS